MRRSTLTMALLAAMLLAVGLVTATETADTVKTVFTIEGMHCDGCSAAIIGALQRIDGVIEASADYEKGEAAAVYKRKKATPEDLKRAIEKLGYTVTDMKTTPVDE